ncbi:MAG: hypothetical protein V2I38_05600 [Alcanivoracaceae bacterium]|jgi:hypothetical protein|nr:hypothetical protein [Alcanivoracaceae bacterium]
MKDDRALVKRILIFRAKVFAVPVFALALNIFGPILEPIVSARIGIFLFVISCLIMFVISWLAYFSKCPSCGEGFFTYKGITFSPAISHKCQNCQFSFIFKNKHSSSSDNQ